MIEKFQTAIMPNPVSTPPFKLPPKGDLPDWLIEGHPEIFGHQIGWLEIAGVVLLSIAIIVLTWQLLPRELPNAKTARKLSLKAFRKSMSRVSNQLGEIVSDKLLAAIDAGEMSLTMTADELFHNVCADYRHKEGDVIYYSHLVELSAKLSDLGYAPEILPATELDGHKAFPPVSLKVVWGGGLGPAK